MVKCANFDQCGHFVDNPRLKGAFCSLQCQAAVRVRGVQKPAVQAPEEKPLSASVVTKPAQGVVTKAPAADKE